MWLSVFFGGIGQFFRNHFSGNDKGTVLKLIGISFGLLSLFICFAIAYTIYDDVHSKNRYLNREVISNRLQFVTKYCSNDPGWISTLQGDEKLIDNVDWVATAENGDSLAVFCRKGKRGYFNLYTGQVTIPAKYSAAWLFSNGIAAVAEGKDIRFIDTSGQPVTDKTFPRDFNLDYLFHGDYCIMGNGLGKVGLIDREGNWRVAPEYDRIIPSVRNYWKMRKGEGESEEWTAYTDKAEPVEMDPVRHLEINDDLGVIYSLPNHLTMAVDFDGNRREMFMCMEIESMDYDTDTRDNEGNRIYQRTTLCRYRMPDGYEGLCRDNGEIVTEPLYWNVQPVGKDLYHCTFKGTDNGVIINSKGEITQI